MKNQKPEVVEAQNNRKQFIIDMHNKGVTYEEIGKMLGVSKQRVAQIAPAKIYSRFFREITPKQCVYTGIRNWMNENKITLSELSRRVYGNGTPNNYHQTTRMLRCGGDYTNKWMIDKILSVTGLTYEEAFKKE